MKNFWNLDLKCKRRQLTGPVILSGLSRHGTLGTRLRLDTSGSGNSGDENADGWVELWVVNLPKKRWSAVILNKYEVKMAILPVWLIFLVCYLSFVVIFMVIPASLGFSFGIRNLYLATLYKVFEVSFRKLFNWNVNVSFVNSQMIFALAILCM